MVCVLLGGWGRGRGKHDMGGPVLFPEVSHGLVQSDLWTVFVFCSCCLGGSSILRDGEGHVWGMADMWGGREVATYLHRHIHELALSWDCISLEIM